MKGQQNRSSAVMQRRIEPHDSLDDFPTPPWATRALIEHVLTPSRVEQKSCLEPAANRGFMFRPLSERFESVNGSDVHDYGCGFPVKDFLWGPVERDSYDWVITNPPFKLAQQFVLRAMDIAREGVAIIARSAFIEGIERYQSIYRHNPPLFVPFVERVPMVKGRVDKHASSATSYAWFVWAKGDIAELKSGLAFIPPCRKSLEKRGDYDLPVREAL